MMFPEGTRSRTGDLLPFRAGAFKLAMDPPPCGLQQDVLGAFVRIFTDTVFASYRARAKREGIEGSAEAGAVTFLQRFGGSLNLNLHLHVVFLDERLHA